MLEKIKSELQKLSNPKKAEIYQRFFKTGKGQYGEGDIFIGLTVPEMRGVAKDYMDLSLDDLQNLLNEKIHEYRLVAIIILTNRYKKGDEKQKKDIFDLYLKNFGNINNWDLVDLSAPHIVGDYLLDKPRDILYEFAKSDHLWTRRISILATFTFIRNGQFDDALKISEILLNDKHDLIHKAVGWMLREVGKKELDVEYEFLEKHYKKMPRTMLRYAIEKFDEEKRKYYMKK